MAAPLGVILGGGAARRMGGGDKGRLLLGGQTLIARVIERVSPQVADTALNANGDPARFADLGLPVLSDSLADGGPLAGVLAGLDWAAGQDAAWIVTAPADTPFLPPDLVPQLLWAAETAGTPIALAETASGLHPTCGLWSVTLRTALARDLSGGARKLRDWAGAQGYALAHFPQDEAFLNINTPEDLALAEAML
nr:molybdenum cofactor guanylyltransferase MobA [Roseisalinus antarcticus]